ncbi:MAG: hypothetical protein ACRDNS_34085, partial [Trebonia sp.]
MRVGKRMVAGIAAILAVALAILGGNALASTFTGPHPMTPAGTTASVPPGPSSPSPSPVPSPSFLLGWYPADSANFDARSIAALPVKPQVVNYYSGWDEPFNTGFAKDARADGIETFVEMEPWNCGDCPGGSVPAMTDIASGGYD